jgi:hypothetical protein
MSDQSCSCKTEKSEEAHLAELRARLLKAQDAWRDANREFLDAVEACRAAGIHA